MFVADMYVCVSLQAEWFIWGLPSRGGSPGIVHTIISVHSHPAIVHTYLIIIEHTNRSVVGVHEIVAVIPRAVSEG